MPSALVSTGAEELDSVEQKKVSVALSWFKNLHALPNSIDAGAQSIDLVAENACPRMPSVVFVASAAYLLVRPMFTINVERDHMATEDGLVNAPSK